MQSVVSIHIIFIFNTHNTSIILTFISVHKTTGSMKQPFAVIGIMAIMLISFQKINAQAQYKFGFGGGVNFTKIDDLVSYPIYEDISGAEYSSSYASFFSNLGTQFFFHGEVELKKFTLALKPGIYSHKFSKSDEILFNTENYIQESSYLLRYINIPLEAKYIIGDSKFRTFLGGSVSYGHLLQQGGEGNHSFIRPKFVAGPVIGAYYEIAGFDLNLTVGYDTGLHVITKKSDRYNTGSSTPYSQSDIKLNQLYATLSILFALDRAESKGSLDCPTIMKSKRSKSKKSSSKKR